MMSGSPASMRIPKGCFVPIAVANSAVQRQKGVPLNPIDGAPAETGVALRGNPATKTCNALVKDAMSCVDVIKAPVPCEDQP